VLEGKIQNFINNALEDFVKAFAVPGFVQETAREYDCEISTPTEASLYNPLTGVKQ
jgi:hypothetical protein